MVVGSQSARRSAAARPQEHGGRSDERGHSHFVELGGLSTSLVVARMFGRYFLLAATALDRNVFHPPLL
jgi:hypothetical protein